MKFLMLIPAFLIVILFAGCGDNKTEDEAVQERQVHSEIVMENVVDVVSLDKNTDGIVYQCPMDYQVISDSMTTCPICKMDLEEYKVAEAQDNLEKHFHQ